MFDKKNFKLLIEKAMGDRKISQYAEDSGVNRTYLSKYINQRLDNPPTPDILKRLSNASYNNISYEKFMEAAGYINIGNKEQKDINVPQEYADKYEVTNLDIKQHAEVLKHAQAFMMDDEVGTDDKQKLFEIVNKLYWESKAINKEKYSKKSKNKK